MAIPSDAHYLAFGKLTVQYASVEIGLKFWLSGMLGIELPTLLILSDPYTAKGLRNVFSALAHARIRPGALQDELLRLVADIESTAALRNAIAHFRWTEGSREGSIKPMHINIQSGRLKEKGHNPDERDWTADEVEAEARKLAAVDYSIGILIVKYDLEKRILPET